MDHPLEEETHDETQQDPSPDKWMLEQYELEQQIQDEIVKDAIRQYEGDHGMMETKLDPPSYRGLDG